MPPEREEEGAQGEGAKDALTHVIKTCSSNQKKTRLIFGRGGGGPTGCATPSEAWPLLIAIPLVQKVV